MLAKKSLTESETSSDDNQATSHLDAPPNFLTEILFSCLLP